MKLIDKFPDVDREVRDAFRLPLWIAAIACIILLGVASWLMMGCSTRTLVVMPDGTVNATVTAVGYCPEATLIRAGSVEMISEASGVGAVVTEVLKP